MYSSYTLAFLHHHPIPDKTLARHFQLTTIAVRRYLRASLQLWNSKTDQETLDVEPERRRTKGIMAATAATAASISTLPVTSSCTLRRLGPHLPSYSGNCGDTILC